MKSTRTSPHTHAPHSAAAFSLPEVVVVVAVIGTLSLGIPAASYVLSSAQETVTELQDTPDPLAGAPLGAGLTYEEENRRYVFNGGAPATTSVPTPTPVPELVLPEDYDWKQLNIKAQGSGTAMYGGQDFGYGELPSFMMAYNGSDGIRLHNAGGYESMLNPDTGEWEPVGSWIDLNALIGDESDLVLLPAADRFTTDSNNAASIRLKKGATEVDIVFIKWVNGSGVTNYRINAAYAY